MMQISPAALAFVQARESFRATAYLDSGGVPTVGYGATGRPEDYLVAFARFQKWDEAGGRVLTGLEARRTAEAAMFDGRAA